MLESLALALFCLCIAILVYVYSGYLWLLRFLSHLKGTSNTPTNEEATPDEPMVTILLTVYNEEELIQARLTNLLDLDYPEDKLQILVASDGSTDQTDNLVEAFDDPRITLFRPHSSLGKTDTQNQAMHQARGEIIVFTDAETRFSDVFLKALVKPFRHPRVGGASGHLLFHREESSGISHGQGYYWDYELALRIHESRLGILAVASGACMAIRKELLKPMEAAYGEDCVIPLMVVEEGYAYEHVPEALAWDRMVATSKGEFKTRVRMTLRNWAGTWSHAQLLNPFKHPGYAFALWSHKLLRWCSPFLLIGAGICAALLAVISPWGILFATGLAALLVMALLGYWGEKSGKSLPLVRNVYSFLLANAGFLVGVLRALKGSEITKYR